MKTVEWYLMEFPFCLSPICTSPDPSPEEVTMVTSFAGARNKPIQIDTLPPAPRQVVMQALGTSRFHGTRGS